MRYLSVCVVNALDVERDSHMPKEKEGNFMVFLAVLVIIGVLSNNYEPINDNGSSEELRMELIQKMISSTT